MLTNTDTYTTNWGHDGSLSSRRVSKTVVYRRPRPTGDNELTSVVDDRNLRIGFFHWIFCVINTESSPPNEARVKNIVTENRLQLVKWEKIVKELLVKKNMTSFVIVTKLMWNDFIAEDGEAGRTNFNFNTCFRTLVAYSTDYVIDLLKFRQAILTYAVFNTHFSRVMKMIGRNVQETVSLRSAKSSVVGPFDHNLGLVYEINDPTTQSWYKTKMKELETDNRNSVVPPFACIVYKAALKLGVVNAFAAEYPPSSLVDAATTSTPCELLPKKRKFQNAKNSVLWYLEQVKHCLLCSYTQTGE
jgi:hypothetical protein